MTEVHSDLNEWAPKRKEDSADCVSGDDLEGSLSWRSGLKMVRDSLRPVPPNRSGPPSPPAPLPPLAASLIGDGPDAHTAGGSDTAGSTMSMSSDPMPRFERPLPPPRTQMNQISKDFKARPALPKLAPVLEESARFESSPVPSPASPSVMPALPVLRSALASADEDLFGARGEVEQPFKQLGLFRLDEQSEQDRSRSSSNKSAGDNSQPELVLPQFKETPQSMMDMSVIDAFQRWNFRRPLSTCCLWHAAVDRLAQLNRDLRSRPCNNDFQLVQDWQCPRCLLLDQLEDGVDAQGKECDLCGYVPHLEYDYDDVDDDMDIDDGEDS